MSPQIKSATMWCHGTSVQVERHDMLLKGGIQRTGQGSFCWLDAPPQHSFKHWFHYSVPTPVVLDAIRPQLKQIFILYWTTDPTYLTITDVHVYDGARRIKAFDNLKLGGLHAVNIDEKNSFAIDPPFDMRSGLGISIGVEAKVYNVDEKKETVSGGLDERRIFLAGAGADFFYEFPVVDLSDVAAIDIHTPKPEDWLHLPE